MSDVEKPRIRKYPRTAFICEGSGVRRSGYDIRDAYERWRITFDNQQVTTGHCENKKRPGGCQLHNLHCGYPACDRVKE